MRGVRGGWLVALVVALLAVVGGATAAVVVAASHEGPSRAVRAAAPEPTRTPLLGAPGPDARVPSEAGLRAALAPVLRDRALGRRLVLSVIDVLTGSPLLETAALTPVVPASTAKLATAVAALTSLAPDRRLTTRVVAGSAPGDVVLVGAGDPTLAGSHPLGGYPRTARLADLAAALTRGGVPVRRVLVDDTLFSGPRTGPGWKPGYVTNGDVTPVSALEVDGGRVARGLHAPRSTDPALQAGQDLAALLKVRAPVTRATAPPGAAVLASVVSPSVAELVEAMLSRSDNDVAEALGRQVALQRGLPATFDGAATAVGQVAGELLGGAALGLHDTSGLSPLDRLRPADLTRLLARAVRDRRYGPLLAGLPVAGFDGTLADRFRKGPATAAAGEVRAKTGTLSGVGALAGLVVTRDGRLLAFDLTADGVEAVGTTASQAALDRVAAVIAGCGCPAPA